MIYYMIWYINLNCQIVKWLCQILWRNDNSHSCSLEVTNVQRGNPTHGLLISSSDASAVKGVLDGPPQFTFFHFFFYWIVSYLQPTRAFRNWGFSWTGSSGWLHHVFPLATGRASYKGSYNKMKKWTQKIISNNQFYRWEQQTINPSHDPLYALCMLSPMWEDDEDEGWTREIIQHTAVVLCQCHQHVVLHCIVLYCMALCYYCSANVTNMWYCIVLYCIAWHYVIIALPISPTCACAKPFDAQMTKTGRSGLSSISLVKDYASKIVCYLYQVLFAICITYYLLFVSTVKEFLITRSSSVVSAANDALSHHKG